MNESFEHKYYHSIQREWFFTALTGLPIIEKYWFHASLLQVDSMHFLVYWSLTCILSFCFAYTDLRPNTVGLDAALAAAVERWLWPSFPCISSDKSTVRCTFNFASIFYGGCRSTLTVNVHFAGKQKDLVCLVLTNLLRDFPIDGQFLNFILTTNRLQFDLLQLNYIPTGSEMLSFIDSKLSFGLTSVMYEDHWSWSTPSFAVVCSAPTTLNVPASAMHLLASSEGAAQKFFCFF